jgi:uncharacterized damage-inducible protein DinB
MDATARLLARHLLDRVLPVLDEAVRRLPPDRLDFRPAPEVMTAKELAYHVYQVVYLLTRALETGRQDPADLDTLPFDPAEATSPEELLTYGRAVQAYLRDAFARLADTDLDQPIARVPRPDGRETLLLAFEEAVHHRGQLITYLRAMGVVPPSIYGRP